MLTKYATGIPTKSQRSHMRKIVLALAIICMILLSIGCPLLSLDDLENPADPDAESYQGYLVIDDPDQIDLYVSNGAFLSDPILIVSDVKGAQSYQIQVADDEMFENVVYESSFATNVLQPELPKTHLRQYWRVRVSRDDEWGAWSRIGSFFYLHPQTLYFDAQGGSNPSSSTKAVAEGNAYGELPTVSHPRKVFAGWWSEPEGNGYQIAADTLVPTDSGHVAYAKWRNYLVDFDSQGGSAVSSVSQVVHGTGLSQPAVPLKVGFVLEGWYTEPGYLNLWDFTTNAIISDMTLYAKWSPLQIGDLGHAGGYVFYDKGIYSDGWRYLEAAPDGWNSNESDSRSEWGAFGYAIAPNITETALGAGETNTQVVVSYHDNLSEQYPDKGDYYTNSIAYHGFNFGSVAAKSCSDYSITVSGITYDDWFLPSKDELNYIYQNLVIHNLGGFSGDYYWSSSEIDSHSAWLQSLSSGSQLTNNKYVNNRVRPVRAF